MPVHLLKDLERLKKTVLEMGTIIEEDIAQAMTALVRCDRALAEKVIVADSEIDRREVLLEEDCLKILALHQPVARDLRFVVAVLKMNNDLERIGDFAVNIAERVIYLSDKGSIPVSKTLNLMADKASKMVRKALDSLVEGDAELARSVVLSDDEVDELRNQVFSEILNRIRNDLDHLEQWVQMLSVARYLERIADLATNISQDVIYLIQGEVVRHRDLSATN